MPTPNRKSIIDNVRTSLVAINGTGAFKTTVTKVDVVLRAWDDVGEGEMPFIGVAPLGKQTYKYLGSGLVDAEIMFSLVAHVRVGIDGSSEIANLEDDIWEALHADPRRGGYAISTTIIDDESDEGSPDRMDAKGGTTTLVMTFKVRYQRTLRAS